MPSSGKSVQNVALQGSEFLVNIIFYKRSGDNSNSCSNKRSRGNVVDFGMFMAYFMHYKYFMTVSISSFYCSVIFWLSKSLEKANYLLQSLLFNLLH